MDLPLEFWFTSLLQEKYVLAKIVLEKYVLAKMGLKNKYYFWSPLMYWYTKMLFEINLTLSLSASLTLPCVIRKKVPKLWFIRFTSKNVLFIFWPWSKLTILQTSQLMPFTFCFGFEEIFFKLATFFHFRCLWLVNEIIK